MERESGVDLGEFNQKIEGWLNPLMQELGLELIELSVKRRSSAIAVEILADRLGGAITIAECAQINRQLKSLIEQQGFLPPEQDFVVQVSSPGLDRSLKTSRDFLRVLGRNVRFYLREPVEGKLEHTGEIRAARDEDVVVSVPQNKTGNSKKGENVCREIVIPFKQIGKAVQMI